MHEIPPTNNKTIKEVSNPEVEKIKGNTTIADPTIVLAIVKIVFIDEFFFVKKLFFTSWILLLFVKGSSIEPLTLLISNFSLYSSWIAAIVETSQIKIVGV